MSKIPRDDWLRTPSNTNLNESAHTATNAATGTRTSFLDSIILSNQYDAHTEEELKEAKQNFILPNPHNTVQHCTRKNRKCMESRACQALQQKGEADEVHQLTEQITALKAKLKDARQTPGGKKVRSRKKVPKGKMLLVPDLADAAASHSGDGPGDGLGFASVPSPNQQARSPTPEPSQVSATPTDQPLTPGPSSHQTSAAVPVQVPTLEPSFPLSTQPRNHSESPDSADLGPTTGRRGKRERRAPKTFAEATSPSKLLWLAGEESPERPAKKRRR
ncbi:hypothetical protein H0H81_001548 [Sphagnurus paluster]|uniref:Uncharacterized protein n=1 Tax=Sphagnurus paluster TaxID=117069 RepID=A0A9P7KHL4_9AGAR|nr:hypothetical protein H0H81_001548 [Sphagnurus paluster]